MKWKLLSLLAGVTLSGCAVVPPFGFNESLSNSSEIASKAPQINPAEVAALQPGSQVEIACDGALDNLTGTVLQASPAGIVLINCVYVNRDTSDRVMSKRRMPCHWIPVRRISKIDTIASAPANFVAPSVEINTDDTEEFSSGQIGLVYE